MSWIYGILTEFPATAEKITHDSHYTTSYSMQITSRDSTCSMMMTDSQRNDFYKFYKKVKFLCLGEKGLYPGTYLNHIVLKSRKHFLMLQEHNATGGAVETYLLHQKTMKNPHHECESVQRNSAIIAHPPFLQRMRPGKIAGTTNTGKKISATVQSTAFMQLF